VMKPLAAPVLGGMVSSLLHVLVVTPVIFFWIRERRLGLQHEAEPDTRSLRAGPVIAIAVVVAMVIGGLGIWQWTRAHRGPSAAPPSGAVVQQVQSGTLQIALLSPTGTLHTGRNAFTFEFRKGNALVDVGRVQASGNMPMPGMVMSSGMEVRRTSVNGRYDASAEFGMAGAWHMSVEWDGPEGKGTASFEGPVQ
jgi:hypothetical protein